MKKGQQNIIAGGLENLLNPTPVTPQQTTTAEAPKEKAIYKTVCYNLNPDLIKAVKDIAYWDRKAANAVVTEALNNYVSAWNKANKK